MSTAATRFPDPLPALALDGAGRQIVSVLVKRTYDIQGTGRCTLAEKQLPLDTRPLEGKDCPPWATELDVAPFKPATDVVVFGKAYAPGGRAAEMDLGVHIAKRSKTIRAFGPRRCLARGAFSRPEPFEAIPLGYDCAYGGNDPAVVNYPAEPQDMAEILAQMMQPPGNYPRNPTGKGYVIQPPAQGLDGLELPNFEDPQDLLTPERLIVGRLADWHRQPLPQGFGWLDMGWFPRCAFGGGLPYLTPPDAVKEVDLGYLPAGYATRLRTTAVENLIDLRLFNGAAPGLVLPYLRGDEAVKITGMDRLGVCNFQLPGDRPKVSIRCRGKELAVDLTPHTVGVLMEEQLVYLVWRASAVPPAGFTPPLPTKKNLEPDELADFQITVA